MTHLAIISARRAYRVAPMLRHCPAATWYVAAGDGPAYRRAGAPDVVEAGDLVTARNAALERAFDSDEPCVQISDDLSRCGTVTEDKQMVGVPLAAVIAELASAAEYRQARLAGVAPTYNAFFFNPKQPVKTHHFVVGDLIWVAPSSPRFNPALPLKEDYDFTAQHLATYGIALRCDYLQASFAHRSNSGGAVAYRTPDLEQQAITTLKATWGAAIRDNPRRPNEVLFDGLPVLASYAGPREVTP